MKETDISKALESLSSLQDKIGDTLKDRFLGELTAQLIVKHGNVSISLLRDALARPEDDAKVAAQNKIIAEYLNALLAQYHP